MAAMPFPCNSHLLCCVNILTVLLTFINKFASCSIPYFILLLYFILKEKKRKKELALTDFANLLGHLVIINY